MEALGLSEAQTRTIEQMMEEGATNARNEGAHQALEAAKLEFRAGVAGSRKPDSFNPTTTSIATYFEVFEPFREIMGLTGKPAVNTFLTYLDNGSRATLSAKPIMETEDWNAFKREIIKSLSGPKDGVQARYEIKRAAQRPDESVAEFGKRLIELGKMGYMDDEVNAKNSVLKDALTGGIIRDEIAIHLINSELTFQQCLEKATEMDASYRAREVLKESDKVAISILKTDYEQRANTTSNVCIVQGYPEYPQTRQEVNMPASSAHQQPSNQPFYCRYCNKPWHHANNCRQQIEDEFQRNLTCQSPNSLPNEGPSFPSTNFCEQDVRFDNRL